MANINDGGPAFPIYSEGVLRDGLTLRDWFAGQALRVFLATEMSDLTRDLDLDMPAEMAYRMADAMLAERSKR